MQPAVFDAMLPVVSVLGGSGFQISPNSEPCEAEPGKHCCRSPLWLRVAFSGPALVDFMRMLCRVGPQHMPKVPRQGSRTTQFDLEETREALRNGGLVRPGDGQRISFRRCRLAARELEGVELVGFVSCVPWGHTRSV